MGAEIAGGGFSGEDFGEGEGDREGRLVFPKESQATASVDPNMGEISEANKEESCELRSEAGTCGDQWRHPEWRRIRSPTIGVVGFFLVCTEKTKQRKSRSDLLGSGAIFWCNTCKVEIGATAEIKALN
ncbi:hypothetical protein U1Q18_023831 [Sarracenia purpurea var. burkii]